jgi:hypothetical protein
MGALLVYFAVGAILSVPPLGYYVLRTRRELNELRAELRRRGLVGPDAGSPTLPGAAAAQQQLAGAVPPAAPDQPARDAATYERRG